MSDSTIYTIGTALRRAQDSDIAVELLVEGQWLAGRVAALDGHGVVLHSEVAEHAVVRMGSVSAVRVLSELPFQTTSAIAVPVPRFHAS